jgi:hypothetical protein
MLVHVAARSVLTLTAGAHGQWHALILLATAGAALLGLAPWLRMRMTRIATLLLLAQVVVTFPITANHVFLEVLVMALLAFLDESREDESVLLLRSLRGMTVIFFFYTGLQKVLYGTYFDGQFLGWVTASQDRFAWLFQHVIDPAELARLREQGTGQAGTGPFTVDSTLFVVMSNAVYVFEMGAALLLLWPRTRAATAIASILFVVAIEAGAREFVFGAMMIGLLMLFLPLSWLRFAFPLVVAMYIYLIAAAFDVVPMFEYAI